MRPIRAFAPPFAPPTPSPPGGAWGSPGSPYVHIRPHARSAQRRDEHGASLGGPPPPWPSPAGGGNRAPPRREGFGSTGSPQVGKPGFPMAHPRVGAAGVPQAGVRFDRLTAGGETRVPHLPTAGGSGWRPHRQRCGSTGSPQVGKPGFPSSHPRVGAAGAPQAGVRFDRLTAGGETRVPHLPPAGGSGWRPHRQGCGSTGSPQVGKPGFPSSHPRLGAAGAPTGRGAVRQAHRRWGNPGSPVPTRGWERLASHRQGCGSTGSPQVGKPGFPVCSHQAPCAERTPRR